MQNSNFRSYRISAIFVCFVVSKYVSPTAHFSIQWRIPIGKLLSQASKTIKLTIYKGKQLKWRYHNDATIPKVELWFQLWHCYADFEVVYTFELMTQPSENYSGAENR